MLMDGNAEEGRRQCHCTRKSTGHRGKSNPYPNPEEPSKPDYSWPLGSVVSVDIVCSISARAISVVN